MKRKMILYIAMSLDGYIADGEGGIKWLDKFNTPEVEENINNFIKTIDTIIMGRVTYEQIVNELSPNHWIYEGKKSFVFSRDEHKSNENVEFIFPTEYEREGVKSFIDIQKFSNNLKSQEGKDIWIMGGSQLANEFIYYEVIDEYIITILPIILGGGTSLFLNENPTLNLCLKETIVIKDIIQIKYIPNA